MPRKTPRPVTLKHHTRVPYKRSYSRIQKLLIDFSNGLDATITSPIATVALTVAIALGERYVGERSPIWIVALAGYVAYVRLAVERRARKGK